MVIIGSWNAASIFFLVRSFQKRALVAIVRCFLIFCFWPTFPQIIFIIAIICSKQAQPILPIPPTHPELPERLKACKRTWLNLTKKKRKCVCWEKAFIYLAFSVQYFTIFRNYIHYNLHNINGSLFGLWSLCARTSFLIYDHFASITLVDEFLGRESRFR